jgi:hypothetical protein
VSARTARARALLSGLIILCSLSARVVDLSKLALQPIAADGWELSHKRGDPIVDKVTFEDPLIRLEVIGATVDDADSSL